MALSAAVAHAQNPSARQRIVLVDRIVAVVNNEVITRIELVERIERVLEDLRRQKIASPPREEMEQQALERMVMDKVQFQYAKETGVKVDELDLDRAIERIAETNNLSLPEFRRMLERDGIPYDKFRDDLRHEILLTRLREREVDNKIAIAENEIDLFIEQQKETGAAPEEYRLAHILIRIPEQAGPDQIDRLRSRAEEVAGRLSQGADFAQLAASHSDAPDGLKGGDMGWRSRERLPVLFADALAKMQPGDVSNVLRSPAGFHLLKLFEKRGGDAPLMVEQALVRHILVKTSESVSEEEARRRLAVLRERLLNKAAEFTDLARTNSDDGSASRGGELGWIYPGDTVPEFERAFRSLKIMEISEPVKTPFGWHLIQVVNRRVADMSADRKRIEARRVLRERKSDEAYQEWLRQLRDRAYVEIRLGER